MARRKLPPKIRDAAKKAAVAPPTEEVLSKQRDECARGAEAARYITNKRTINEQDPDLRRTIAAFDRRFRIIYEMERRFLAEGTALAAWDAYLTCRQWNLPIPEWVLRYLDGAATLLVARVPGKKTAEHVAEAFGLHSASGRGNVFTQYLTLLERQRVVREVLAMKRANPTETDVQIFMDVAENWTTKKGKEISCETVRNWYYDLKDKLAPRQHRK